MPSQEILHQDPDGEGKSLQVAKADIGYLLETVIAIGSAVDTEISEKGSGGHGCSVNIVWWKAVKVVSDKKEVKRYRKFSARPCLSPRCCCISVYRNSAGKTGKRAQQGNIHPQIQPQQAAT
jgi:hypothetical protein